MILRSIRVRQYKNFLDSGEVALQDDVTCLVGKNESGKSALLQALYRLNPIPSGHPETFVELRDYPRRAYARDRERITQTVPITATFELEDEDVRAVEAVHGPRALSSREVTVGRSYENRLVWETGPAGDSGPDPGFEAIGLDGPLDGPPEAAGPEWNEDEDEDEDGGGWEERLAALGFDEDLGAVGSEDEAGRLADEEPPPDVWSILAERLPGFLYFDEYSIMPGRLSLPQIERAGAEGGLLSAGERSALSLIRLSGLDLADFSGEDYEARRASLEAAAGDLTEQVFEYWSQNRDLSVEFDVDFDPAADNGGEGPFIELRIRNHRHGVTLNFGHRSQGFTWFFSLLASLSQLTGPRRLILLLDEPGASLHATAQHDLLRFIDERLTASHQVLYSTHSPFMVDAKHLERVRTVEDRDGEGSRVSGELFDHASDTRIPVTAAFGHKLIGSLVTGGSGSLFVKEPSDHVYLSAMSTHLESLGRARLDPRWSIVPVGGLVGLSAFAVLSAGDAEHVAVLFDVPEGEGFAADAPLGKRLLENRGIIRIADFAAPPSGGEDDDELGGLGGLDEFGELPGDGAAGGPDGAFAGEIADEAESPFAAALAAQETPAAEMAAADAAGAETPLGDPGGDLVDGLVDGLAGDLAEDPFEDLPGDLPADPSGDFPDDFPADPLASRPETAADADAAGAGIAGGETPPPAGGRAELEVEDLFSEDFFTDLVNRSGTAAIERFEIRGAGSIVRRIEAATGVGLDRLLPARHLLDQEADPLAEVDDPTLDRFESLFRKINSLLLQ